MRLIRRRYQQSLDEHGTPLPGYWEVIYETFTDDGWRSIPGDEAQQLIKDGKAKLVA